MLHGKCHKTAGGSVPKPNSSTEDPKQRLREGFNSVLSTSTGMIFTIALDLKLDKRGAGTWLGGRRKSRVTGPRKQSELDW